MNEVDTMITFEHARELLGDGGPNDPYYLEFFLESLDSLIKKHGEEWVKEHKGFLNAEWEYVATLL